MVLRDLKESDALSDSVGHYVKRSSVDILPIRRRTICKSLKSTLTLISQDGIL